MRNELEAMKKKLAGNMVQRIRGVPFYNVLANPDYRLDFECVPNSMTLDTIEE